MMTGLRLGRGRLAMRPQGRDGEEVGVVRREEVNLPQHPVCEWSRSTSCILWPRDLRLPSLAALTTPSPPPSSVPSCTRQVSLQSTAPGHG